MMDITGLVSEEVIGDERAVSPVIGVILMVAITVILAAVIGTFVLGLGDQVQSTSPQASFTFTTENLGDGTATNDKFIATHDGGDSIEQNNFKLVAGGNTFYEDGADQSGTDTTVTTSNLGSPIIAGSSISVAENAVDKFSGETDVRAVWKNPDSDQTATLGTFQFTAD